MLGGNKGKLALLTAACLGLSAACGSDAPVDEVLRDDLNLTTYQARIENGLSSPIEIEIPTGVESFLIEVRGKKGKYFLSSFITPGGEDLIEAAKYVTRGAREIPGLVDWLYPNDPSHRVEEGTYTILVRGTDAFTGNQNLTEDIDVLVYTPDSKPAQTCGITLDFLVDDAALALDTFDEAVAAIVQQVDLNYRQIGIKIDGYQTYRVNMQSSDIDLDDGSAVGIVDDVLSKTVANGAARPNAVHVLLVRRIGGSDNPTFDPAGYSMGLPGPYAHNRGTSAVLVSTELYTGGNDLLDADGLASSLAHEIGHFLGLYHTSERNGRDNDPIADTPECESEFSCTDEFRRNLMTSSFWLQGGPPSFRNRFTEGQGKIMRGHPLCEPMPVEIVQPPIEECTLECDAPTTCSVKNMQMSCEAACNPEAPNCSTGTCQFDDLGTYVCL
jgi:hypothetical protein